MNRVHLFDEPHLKVSHKLTHSLPCPSLDMGIYKTQPFLFLPFCPFFFFFHASPFTAFFPSSLEPLDFDFPPPSPLPFESQVGRQRRQESQGPNPRVGSRQTPSSDWHILVSQVGQDARDGDGHGESRSSIKICT
jgi:hypothetical protein